jgi:hypothetical protein
MRFVTSTKIVSILCFFVVILICFFLYSFYSSNSGTVNAVKCNQKYGLCPAAQCIPNPNDKTQAYCWCDVVNGVNYSLGNDSCEKIKGYTSETGEEVIYSTFSPIIASMGYTKVSCSPQDVNLNCMNKICSVNPHNPSKAICVCDVSDNKGLDWVTFNENNKPMSCNYQSGASMQDYKTINSFIDSSKKKN